MSTHDEHSYDVSFAEVAAEDPAVSVEHEHEATDDHDTLAERDLESDNDTPPSDPAIASVLVIGPTHEGEATVI